VSIDTVVTRVDRSTQAAAVDGLIDDRAETEQAPAAKPDRAKSPRQPAWKPNEKTTAAPGQKPPMWQARYRPVWDVAKEVVVAYRFTPTTTLDDGQVLIDHDAAAGASSGAEEHRDLAGFDRLFIQSVRDGLQHDGRSPSRCLLICPVHYESFATREGQRIFLELISGLSPTVRADLILELVGMPDGLPQVRLAQIVPPLKQSVRAVHCRAWLNGRLLKDLADIGVAAVGFDIGDIELSEKSIFEAMPRFAAAAADVGLGSYAYGVDRLSLATHAVCSGLSHLAGDAIMRSISKIEYVFRYGPRDLVYPLARSHGKRC
jgi:hypothetical protein